MLTQMIRTQEQTSCKKYKTKNAVRQNFGSPFLTITIYLRFHLDEAETCLIETPKVLNAGNGNGQMHKETDEQTACEQTMHRQRDDTP